MGEYFKPRRKKVCQMCLGKDVDYKNVEIMKKYINESGKILPRRMTGACAKHQRCIETEVKRSRFIGLIPFKK